MSDNGFMTPALGQPAPDFTLPGITGAQRRSLTLSEARGSSVVLAFYPGDNTPVCTRQLCSYQDDLGTLTGLEAQVWGISSQDVDSHERFAAKRGLTFPLLADTDRAVQKLYGVAGPLGHTKRSIFVIDAAGVLRWSHISLLGVTYQDTEAIAAALRTCQPPYPDSITADPKPRARKR
ncbi:MAG: thioredoxin-dependent peroxiredoxin [Actinomycetota bacterium]|nr:thioredoxin-dependent peroxiredoxin [Actinomycetota bacterium]